MKRTLPISNQTAKLVLAVGVAAMLGRSLQAASTVFAPGNLAVLQLGDGGTNRCLPLGAITGITNYAASDIFGSRQTQIFIDQFDPNAINQTNPSVQVAIPTNGATAMLINGNAGTEGCLSLSGDKSVLAFSGYQGDILSQTTGGQTAPSNLSYDRGIGTVDAFTNYSNPYRGGGWYGVATGKTNPRGVATDGLGNFWGCGNGYGSLYFSTINGGPVQFQNIALTSCSKIINNTLYASVKNSEAVNFYPAGIYSFVDFFNNPVPYPSAASFLHLEIPANSGHNSVIGFDINPQGTIAYMVDNTISTKGGVSKYIKTGLTWSMAYHLIIPGYTNFTSGIMVNPGNTNVPIGCFSVAVDWSGSYPVVYATTADSGVNNAYYGNRVIRIDDTNTITSGINLVATTNILRTVVKPPGTGTAQLTNIVYKAVSFTPDLRPQIARQPASWSAVVGDNVSFNVGTTSPYILSYQWFLNGTSLPGEVSATLTRNAVALVDNNSTLQCVVTNDYGAVTSSIATLTVSTTPILPVFSAVQNITNFVGNSRSVAVSFTAGTDPKGGYQWYFNGTNLLTDGPTGNGSALSGTASNILSIIQANTNDAGVYSLAVTNVAGTVSNKVANFFTPFAPPVFIQPPLDMTTFLGRNISDTVSAFGQLLTYKWYTSTNKAAATPTGLKPLTDAGDYSGTSTATLQITGATTLDATNYVIVVSTPGGSITSAPVVLNLSVAPAHTFISYTNAGQVYTQDFNTLPIPGLGSAEGANPLRLAISMTNIPAMLTNGNPATIAAGIFQDVTFSIDNPVDLGYPVITNGAIGGLGLSKNLGGWYGWAQTALVFAAGRGDQSQGALIDNGGNYYADGASLASITNRALGLIATTKTGTTAMGAAFINNSANTYNTITLSYTGELWRNNPNAQPLKFGYFITDTNTPFQPGVWDSTNGIYYVASLDVVFATSPTTTINDGTQSSNQVSLAVTSLTISNWPSGSALWLTWQALTLGTAQDVAIDNLTFSATNPSLVVPVTPPVLRGASFAASGVAAGMQFTFTNTPGVSASFTVWGTTNLTPAAWQNLGHPTEGVAGQYQFIDASATNRAQRFYRVTSP